MNSSYSTDDVEILLKDITGMVEPLPASVREKNIQRGVHYCEMLPLEYKPSEKYMYAYEKALMNYAKPTAKAISVLAEKIYQKKGDEVVLVSLARAGIPLGILIKRYIRNKYGVEVSHYAISIIRGRGIDKNAMNYILARHSPKSIQFVDGWIGKGAILKQLKDALYDYPKVDTELGVISDPANITDLCGTDEDILIPSSCLNATVTGLISRTFLRADIIGKDDFHGAAYYSELKDEDLSEGFLKCIESKFDYNDKQKQQETVKSGAGLAIVESIAKEYQVDDINFIKPGIGESTRVLLRRVPWKILVNPDFKDSDEIEHIFQLAAEKGVICEISRVALGNYKVCGIIKRLSDV